METSIVGYQALAEKAQIAHVIANQAEEAGNTRTADVLRAGAVKFERDLYRQALEDLAEAGNVRAVEVLALMPKPVDWRSESSVGCRFPSIGASGLVPLCERAVDVVRQTAGIVASPSDRTYDIWTDGACAHKTTGAGGYAAVLVARRPDGSVAEQWELSGGDFETTNNRMELMAVIAGLRDSPARVGVCIHTDSTYVMKNFRERLNRWQGNGWQTADRKPVKNRDLWEELSAEVDRRKVEWVKVAGHTGVELNDRADKLACAQKDAYAERSRRRPVE